MTSPALALHNLRFAWPGAQADTLQIERLTLDAGQTLFLRGPSGCGKSTLLSLAAGVLLPQAGTVQLLGQGWAQLGAAARDQHRADHLGYVFQQFNLLPYLSVLDTPPVPPPATSAAACCSTAPWPWAACCCAQPLPSLCPRPARWLCRVALGRPAAQRLEPDERPARQRHQQPGRADRR